MAKPTKMTVQENSILIEDSMKRNIQVMYFVLGINLFNSIMFPLGSDNPITDGMNLVWLAIGLFSLIAIFFQLKKVSINELEKSFIDKIEYKQIMSTQKLVFHINNNKVREVAFKSEEDLKKAIQSLKTFNYEIS